MLRGLREWLPAVDRSAEAGFRDAARALVPQDLQASASGADDVPRRELIDPGTPPRSPRRTPPAPRRTSELHSLVFLRHWLEKWS